jgi:hypothetical protein
MRTTVELPPALLRAAKARSAERGESLKGLLTRAVAAELGLGTGGGPRPRIRLPLFGHAAGRRANPSNADLERALAEVDAAGVGPSTEPRRGEARRRRRTPR